MGKRSREKGRRGELEVLHHLQDWWSKFEPGIKFVRTPLSGGWHAAPDFRASGDLMTTSETFPFCVEVKLREAWSTRSFVLGRKSPVWGWWEQACAAASKVQTGNRFPVVVMPMLWARKAPLSGCKSQWVVLVPREHSFEWMPTPDFVWEQLPVHIQPIGIMHTRLLNATVR